MAHKWCGSVCLEAMDYLYAVILELLVTRKTLGMHICFIIVSDLDLWGVPQAH